MASGLIDGFSKGACAVCVSFRCRTAAGQTLACARARAGYGPWPYWSLRRDLRQRAFGNLAARPGGSSGARIAAAGPGGAAAAPNCPTIAGLRILGFEGWIKPSSRESDQDDDDAPPGARLPPGTQLHDRGLTETLKGELDQFRPRRAPHLVETVRWAASNGDRSENGDYICGKKPPRDRPAHPLPDQSASDRHRGDAVRAGTPSGLFGATVTVCDVDGDDSTRSSASTGQRLRGRISWIAPLSRRCSKAREGDVIRFRQPGGLREIEVLEIRYGEAGA